MFNISETNRSKIRKITLNALRTRQSLVKGERLVRHEMRAVLPRLAPFRSVIRLLSSMVGNIEILFRKTSAVIQSAEFD